MEQKWGLRLSCECCSEFRSVMRLLAGLFRLRHACILFLGLSTLPPGGSAQAAIVGFGGDGTGWTLNGGPSVSADVLHLTDGGGSEARSTFFNTPQAYQNGFTVHFTWDATPGTGLADGLTFLLQNDPRGVAALGVGGGSLGYAGGTAAITPSVSLQLNLYNGDGLTRGSGLRTKGNTGLYSSLGGITFGTTPIDVTMTYDPSTYQMTQTYQQGATTFSKRTPFIINGTLSGSGTALIGFTGGTGGQTSVQKVSNFSYTPQFKASAPIVLRDTLTSGNGLALALHTPEVGGQWSVPVGSGLLIANSLIDTTGAARVARTNFTSALGPGEALLLSLHVESIPNFFGDTNFISGFDLLAGDLTELFFGKVSSANGWSIATDPAGANLFGSSSIIGASEIAFQYNYDTGEVGLWVNDVQVVGGLETPGLAIDAFGFENNNGGDVKFGNVQAAFLLVPEPSVPALAGLSALTWLCRRRRRRDLPASFRTVELAGATWLSSPAGFPARRLPVAARRGACL